MSRVRESERFRFETRHIFLLYHERVVDHIASSSVATECVEGKTVDEVLTIKNTEIAKHLSLPPVKLHCSMLAEDAIKAAIRDYGVKAAKNKTSSITKAGQVSKA